MLKRSWQITKETFEFILLYPKILKLGFLEFAFLFLSSALIFGLLFLISYFFFEESWFSPVWYTGLAIFYVGIVFINKWFQATVVHFTTRIVWGDDCGIKESFFAPCKAFLKLTIWALISSVVGVFLGKTRRRTIRARSLTGTWRILTVMVIPVIMFEERTLWRTLKRSLRLFRSTWGETVLGRVGVGIIMGILELALFPFFILIGLVAGEEAMYFAVYAIGIPYSILLGILYSVISGIFEAAMYHYAITKEGGLYSGGVVQSGIS